MNLNKTIAWVTSALVLVVAIISFILSYHALREMAFANGLAGQLSYLWPLLVDLSMIVFSLCVVTAHLYGETVWKQWLLVGLYTITTCGFNWLHAPDTWIAHTVAIVPPVSLFFSFELLMSQLKNGVKRSQKITTLTAWDNALAIAQKGFDDLREQTTKALEEKETQLDALGEQHQAEIQERNNALEELANRLEIAANPVAHRRQMVYQARQGEQPTPFRVLAEEWNVSEQTIKNDMAHWSNGAGK